MAATDEPQQRKGTVTVRANGVEVSLTFDDKSSQEIIIHRAADTNELSIVVPDSASSSAASAAAAPAAPPVTCGAVPPLGFPGWKKVSEEELRAALRPGWRFYVVLTHPVHGKTGIFAGPHPPCYQKVLEGSGSTRLFGSGCVPRHLGGHQLMDASGAAVLPPGLSSAADGWAERMLRWGQTEVRERKEKVGMSFLEAANDKAFRLKMTRAKGGGPNRKSLASYCKALQLMEAENEEPEEEIAEPLPLHINAARGASGGLDCQQCGKEVDQRQRFCGHCGEEQPMKQGIRDAKKQKGGGKQSGAWWKKVSSSLLSGVDVQRLWFAVRWLLLLLVVMPQVGGAILGALLRLVTQAFRLVMQILVQQAVLEFGRLGNFCSSTILRMEMAMSQSLEGMMDWSGPALGRAPQAAETVRGMQPPMQMASAPDDGSLAHPPTPAGGSFWSFLHGIEFALACFAVWHVLGSRGAAPGAAAP